TRAPPAAAPCSTPPTGSSPATPPCPTPAHTPSSPPIPAFVPNGPRWIPIGRANCGAPFLNLCSLLLFLTHTRHRGERQSVSGGNVLTYFAHKSTSTYSSKNTLGRNSKYPAIKCVLFAPSSKFACSAVDTIMIGADGCSGILSQ